MTLITLLLIALIAGQQVALLLQARRFEAAIDRLLARISTEPRVVVRPAVPQPDVDPGNRQYISDEPYDDARWNEYRGEAPEDEPMVAS